MNNELSPQDFLINKNSNNNIIKKNFLQIIYKENIILKKTNYKDLIDIFFSNLLDANKYYNNNKNNILNNISFIENNIDLQEKDNTFFPKNIQTFIEDNISTIYSYEFKIFHRKIRVNFCFFDFIPNNMNDNIMKIYLLLYLISLYSNNSCSEELLLNIFFTPFYKEFPDDQLILDRINVNSAWRYQCTKKNSITVYREEEWFKVLCHEVIHTFGLDFNVNTDDVNTCKNFFNINSDYLVNETYCEFWAIILNTLIHVFMDYNTEKKNFYKNFSIIIKREKQFAIFQLVKILSFMELSYDNIINNDEVDKYKEKTNVFCYYILKAIILYNDTETMEHFIEHNKNILNFDKNKVGKFIDYIIRKSRDTQFINIVQKMKYNIEMNYHANKIDDELITTMRMSLYG